MFLSVESGSLGERGGGGAPFSPSRFQSSDFFREGATWLLSCPCGLLVVLTPLYGSYRPWVIDRLPLVAS